MRNPLRPYCFLMALIDEVTFIKISFLCCILYPAPVKIPRNQTTTAIRWKSTPANLQRGKQTQTLSDLPETVGQNCIRAGKWSDAPWLPMQCFILGTSLIFLSFNSLERKHLNAWGGVIFCHCSSYSTDKLRKHESLPQTKQVFSLNKITCHIHKF